MKLFSARVLLAVISLVVVYPSINAQDPVTADQLQFAPAAALPGFNLEGGSVATNFLNAFNEKQFFLIKHGSFVYEKPASDTVLGSYLYWCSDLTFSDFLNSNVNVPMAYVGRCVGLGLTRDYEMAKAGAQLVNNAFGPPGEFRATLLISATFVEQANLFSGQMHKNSDNYVHRFYDDGRPTSPRIIWESHDEGDASPKSATSSLSGFGEYVWTPTEEVAKIFNTTVADLGFTPDTFKDVYAEVWIKGLENEASNYNANPEAVLEIIEQVKDETQSGKDPVVAEERAEDDPSDGSGRKLATVATRFASAVLYMFGI